jgi:hypothetical protein
LHFYDYLPFEKDLALDLYNFEFPLPSFIEIGLLVLEKKIFKKFSGNFYSFAIISPWGRGLSFICTILNPLCLRMLCANFD